MKRSIDIAELKVIQLDILQAVHDYCQAHGLNYSLGYGSMIGAVRHRGYIPWDDDIDLLMMRADYEQFLEHFEHPYLKAYDFRHTEDYAYPFAKVADTRTVLVENNSSMNLGINIDIFPVDYLYDTTEESSAFIRSLRPLKRQFRMKLLQPTNKNSWPKRIAIRLSKVLVAHTSMKKLVKAQYALIDKLPKQPTSYVAMVSGNAYGPKTERNIWSRHLFDHYVDLPFEDRHFKCIANYDSCLRAEYGDYLSLPPVGQRTSPHSLCEIYWID